MNTAKAPKPFQYDPQLMGLFTHVWPHHLESDIVETYFGSGRTGNLSYLKSIMAKPAYTIQEKNHFRRGGGEEKEQEEKEIKGNNHNSKEH
ncbi:hypothetical protein KI688_005499 [Linnemannia hyalina]|uniref:Uncharacterized protein n=1 Tax=Linnemannia hyalina TaxID=64524 RepID=A0A9P8BXF5_9FUNG|nr:hypothetical protein KI688_005499 [Linnemannia hyalina]